MPRDVRDIDVRHIKVAAAQMGPNNEGTSREEIVERMLGLLAEAVREGVELIAYPEMALTTYFPKKIRPDFDQFFETEVPPKALEPLLRRAAEARIAVHVDRKSTRLNSSHVRISYAVFCLKKKNNSMAELTPELPLACVLAKRSH